MGSLELLVAPTVAAACGAGRWVVSDVDGALGPGGGALLTWPSSWRAIFVVQVQVAVSALPTATSPRGQVQPRDNLDGGDAGGWSGRHMLIAQKTHLKCAALRA